MQQADDDIHELVCSDLRRPLHRSLFLSTYWSFELPFRASSCLSGQKVVTWYHTAMARPSSSLVTVPSGNGSIDLLEFASVLILPLSGPVTAGLFEEGVERLFKILDQNGDGQVTLDEFRSEMAKVFPNWNPDALVPLFREIDSGESGAIDKNEFLAYFRNVL
jgi:hypothetical protein